MIVSDEITARFWTKVEVGGPDDCWPYLGYIDHKTGYGHFNTKYPEIVGSHRYAFATKGEKPGKGFVRHTCDYRPCCNPNHLIIGTHKQNMQDMVERKRHVGNRDIDEETAVQIRICRSEGASAKELGDEYGLTPQHISNICTGVYWPDAGGPLTRRFEISDQTIYSILSDSLIMSQKMNAIRNGVSFASVQQIVQGRKLPKTTEGIDIILGSGSAVNMDKLELIKGMIRNPKLAPDIRQIMTQTIEENRKIAEAQMLQAA